MAVAQPGCQLQAALAQMLAVPSLGIGLNPAIHLLQVIHQFRQQAL